MFSPIRQTCGRPFLANCSGLLIAPKLRLLETQVPIFSLAHRSFCSSGESKPPKGFEKFYRQADRKADTKAPESKSNGKAEKAEAKNSKTGPTESTKGKAESSSGGGSSSSAKGPEKDGANQPTPEMNRNMLVAAVATMFFIYMYGERQPKLEEITIQEMIKEYLMKGHVEKIAIVNMEFCRVKLRHDAPGTLAGKEMTISLGNLEVFESKVEGVQRELGVSPLDFVPIQYVTERDMYDILPHLPSLILFVVMMLFARSMASGMGGAGGMGGGGPGGGRNMFSMGKAFPQGAKDLKSKVKFTDVAGMEQAKREVVEFVDFLKNPEKFTNLGAKCPKGGLLVGPPGTGKTLLAKAVAGEAGCPFYSMSGSDFIEMFVGVGPSRVRDLFAQARASAPSIIFIDEIDAVGRKRGKGGFSGGGNDERENTLNQLLVEMDGFATSTGIVVLASTNRADILDDALKRPGRFDRTIAIDKPDLAERKTIYLVHLKPVTLAKHLVVDDVASRMAALTPGFAGADIANVCNEAAIFAARRSSATVEMVDFEQATERVIGGLPKHNSLMSPEEKHTVALHECGHAIAGWFLEHTDPLLKVTIVPRSSGALGFAQYLPAEMSLHSREAILDRIAMALGGRAAEEMFVGAISTGASDDLDKVTKMAYGMITQYGMNEDVGLVSFQQSSTQEFYKPYSEAVGQLIDSEARKLVEEQYNRVKELLEEKREPLLALAAALEAKETLVYGDIKGVLGERPFGIKEAYSKYVEAGANAFTAGSEAPEESGAAPWLPYLYPRMATEKAADEVPSAAPEGK